MSKYFALEQSGQAATLHIFGELVAPGYDTVAADVSGHSLAMQLQDLKSETIHVHINSLGGHASEGLAIYNMLRQHPAKIVTFNDGFCCSAAVLVYLAGDIRIASPASIFMVHNCWTCTSGNASDLRKEADDLEKLDSVTMAPYLEKLNISEDELKELFSNETYLLPEEAKAIHLATEIGAEAGPGVMQRLQSQLVAKRVQHTVQQKAAEIDYTVLAAEVAKAIGKNDTSKRQFDNRKFFNLGGNK